MVKSGQIAVGTTATEIPVTCKQPFRIQVKNLDNTDEIFIGDMSVTTTTGIRLDKEERIEFFLAPFDKLFVVSTKAGHNVGFILFSQTQDC
jgi:hypothetical protein